MEEKTMSENKIIDQDCFEIFQAWEQKICEKHDMCIKLPTKEEALDRNNIVAYYSNSLEFWAMNVPTTINLTENLTIDQLTQLKFRWGQIRIAIIYEEMKKNNITNEDLQLYKLAMDIAEEE
jgi:hypothetical protein